MVKTIPYMSRLPTAAVPVFAFDFLLFPAVHVASGMPRPTKIIPLPSLLCLSQGLARYAKIAYNITHHGNRGKDERKITNMERVFNFSAGPSMLPLEVLQKAQSELVNYGTCGMSVMEMSHRSKDYEAIIEAAEADLRTLMAIPDNYTVLFLQGGASLQFDMIPMNLLTGSKKADFVITGQWSKRAVAEASKFGTANVVASSADKVFNYIPDLDPNTFSKDADYFHITLNNTIYGTRFTKLPDVGNVPLIADMSSSILSEQIDITKFGMIYAGAQKNLGPAGVTVVIIRNDLIGHEPANTPTMLSYAIHAKEKSMFNTPPTYAIYVMGLVFKWMLERGGVSEMQKINEKKAAILYNFLDNSKLFKGTVVKNDRSLMNIPFILPTEELNDMFIKTAKQAGFVNLKGHRTVGGMRASIYNAMPVEGVEALVEFMAKFEGESLKN